MAKKAVQNKPGYISNELMSEFTKLDFVNIKDFFESKSLFIVLIPEGTKKDGFKYQIANQFVNRERFIANRSVLYAYIFDDNIVKNNVKIKTTETELDYQDSIDSLKYIIKDYINKGVLYAKKI